MDDSDEESRLMAACEQCGTVYAAFESADGTIIPIGSREGCRCGGTRFTPVTTADLADSADAEEAADDD